MAISYMGEVKAPDIARLYVANALFEILIEGLIAHMDLNSISEIE